MLSIIAIIGKNRELGKDNDLIWNIPGDLKRFRAITKGHPVVMGRRTFQSIGHPLQNRENFVITHDSSFAAEGITIVSSLDEAIEKAKLAPGGEETFIIGGGQIYAQAITRADRLYLTVVDKNASGADTFFPDYSRLTKIIEKIPQEENGIRYTFLTLEPEK
jgi:dihydrofolate reductase